MKVIVHAFQEYGKSIDRPIVMEFCCWQSLRDWLGTTKSLYKCEECGKK